MNLHHYFRVVEEFKEVVLKLHLEGKVIDQGARGLL